MAIRVSTAEQETWRPIRQLLAARKVKYGLRKSYLPVEVNGRSGEVSVFKSDGKLQVFLLLFVLAAGCTSSAQCPKCALGGTPDICQGKPRTLRARTYGVHRAPSLSRGSSRPPHLLVQDTEVTTHRRDRLPPKGFHWPVRGVQSLDIHTRYAPSVRHSEPHPRPCFGVAD